MLLLTALLLFRLSAASGAEALIQDRTHESQVFGEVRHYRIFLPADYGTAAKRYPVIYWFHGWGERYNRCPPGKDYDSGTDYGGDNIANFVAKHDVIVVKWDGYNPRKPDENYPRPYNIGPVETNRQFPLYFPEFVNYIDSHYRTLADREHRATAGLSMGGFMSLWIAGKYPDLVSSASSFMPSTEFVVGPRGFPVEYRHDEMRGNYDGVRTRLITGSRDFIRFYHRQMNALWKYTRPFYETEQFDSDHGTPGLAKTLAFHMNAFAHPLPRPVIWSHNDVYPNFGIWGWGVASNRQQPGFTVLQNVSGSGFRSSVREWLPDGSAMPQVKLQIISARLFCPGRRYTISLIRLRDGRVRRYTERADHEGSLRFNLDGEDNEVGISSAPAHGILALTGYRVESGAWATAGQLVRVRVRFDNKGDAVLTSSPMRWESPNPDVQLVKPVAALPRIAPGASAEVHLSFLVRDKSRVIVKLFAVKGDVRLPLEIPLFPPAPAATDFRLADGKVFTVYEHAVEPQKMSIGEGNGDGLAAAGERIAVLFPDAGGYRLAELFSNDVCVNNSVRLSDSWASYDHVGASVKYSLPLIKAWCPSGHVVHFLARVQLPNKPDHRIRFAAVSFPVRARPRADRARGQSSR